MATNHDETRDALTDAREAMDGYWGWEAFLAQEARGEIDVPADRVKETEEDQEALLERAKASALVSIAESLAVIAEAVLRPYTDDPRSPDAHDDNH